MKTCDQLHQICFRPTHVYTENPTKICAELEKSSMSETQCSQIEIYGTYLFYVLCGLVILFVLYGFCLLIKNMTSDMPKLLKLSLISFYIFSILSTASLTFHQYHLECILNEPPHVVEKSELYQISFICFLFSYQSHWYALVNILFFRLYLVFNPKSQPHQPLKVSNCTIIIFITLSTIYILNTASSAVILIMRLLQDFYLNSFLMIAKILLYYILNIGISLFVTIIFIYKLFKLDGLTKSVKTSEDQQQDSLLPVITKYTILAAVSTISTIVAFVTFGNSFLILLDIFTNFLCVTLSLKHAEKAYQRLCCCIDKKCHDCLGKYQSLVTT